VKQIIEMLEEADKKVSSISVYGNTRRNRETLDEAIGLIREAITKLQKAPLWETPEQREKRTGEPWQEDWPVWYISDSEEPEWKGCSYKEAKEIDEVNDTWIVCAGKEGPPPDGWEPEEEK
jgi:hypothetical protein